ncbi:hypothetical protein [Phenylobacterium sp.]|uniref:hypothetical protein n=1 Tax=Phenylobacterium sp. TaxID=1871053 RepID=UPI0039218080
MTAQRCGSYPLMNLAQDYDVDYGDLLTWADFLRCDRLGIEMSQGRYQALDRAIHRMTLRIGRAEQLDLLHALVAHANARWGQPPQEFAPLIVTEAADA